MEIKVKNEIRNFAQQDFSLISLKKYLQCDYPTFNYYFKVLENKQCLIISRTYAETCYIYIEKNVVYLKRYDSIILPNTSKLANLLQYVSKSLVSENTAAKYDRFLNLISKSILKYYPGATLKQKVDRTRFISY